MPVPSILREKPNVTRQRFTLLLRRWSDIHPTLQYWMETEVHVYAFSIAANVLLSFYPFLIVLVSICKNFLHWQGAVNAISIAVRDYFPNELGKFVAGQVTFQVNTSPGLQIGSIVLLLFTANGIFEPMEVALNRAWGVTVNRSFWRNQLISYGLVLACGVLALGSVSLTAANVDLINSLFDGSDWFSQTVGAVVKQLAVPIALKLGAIPISILALLLVYWLLPNRKIHPMQVLPAAVVVGLTLELLKWVIVLIWPWLKVKMQHEYGPFQYSVTIILCSFFGALVVLAGAEASARVERAVQAAKEDGSELSESESDASAPSATVQNQSPPVP